MADFDQHITQARKNLKFLHEVNDQSLDYWDWQVTISFYVAVHLVNAHISRKSGLHYRAHETVRNAIYFGNQMSPCKLEQDVYLAYAKLQGLSRRSRYLISDSPNNASKNSFLTFEKHFARAIKNLCKLIVFMEGEYKIKLPTINVRCVELQNFTSSAFEVKK